MSANNTSSFGRDQVLNIINKVLHKVEQASPAQDTIHRELRELHRIIEDMRRDMGAADIKMKHIPNATDELDAVVGATANATGSIMDACEKIEAAAAAVGGEKGDLIAAEVTKIYEACSFQDITGQRIKKVVGTLKTIESKVEALLESLGDKVDDVVVSGDTRTGDAALLNGPQLPGDGVSQSDIDKILAEFDKA